MNITKRYTKDKRKIAYLPIVRKCMYLIACACTTLMRCRSKKNSRSVLKKVFIETLSYCNNNCSFCPASTIYGKKDASHKMSDETFEAIVGQLCAMDYEGVFALYCNNEPLLDERTVDFVRRIRADFPSNRIEIITNGIPLSAALASDLFEAGLSKLIINHYNNELVLSDRMKEFVKGVAGKAYNNNICISLRLKDEVLSNRVGNASNANIRGNGYRLWCSLPFDQMYINYTGSVILCCSNIFEGMNVEKPSIFFRGTRQTSAI